MSLVIIIGLVVLMFVVGFTRNPSAADVELRAAGLLIANQYSLQSLYDNKLNCDL